MNDYLASNQLIFDLIKKLKIFYAGDEIKMLFSRERDLHNFFLYCNKEYGIDQERFFSCINILMYCEKALHSMYASLGWESPNIFYSLFLTFPHVFDRNYKVKEFFYTSLELLFFFLRVINNKKENYDLVFVLHDLYKKREFNNIRNIFYSKPNTLERIDLEFPSFNPEKSPFLSVTDKLCYELYIAYEKEATEDCLLYGFAPTKTITADAYFILFLTDLLNQVLSDLHMTNIFIPFVGDLATVQINFFLSGDKREKLIGGVLLAHLIFYKQIDQLECKFNITREDVFDFFSSLSSLVDSTYPDFGFIVKEMEKFLKHKGIV